MSVRRAGRWDTEIQQGSTFARTLRFDVDVTGLQFRGQIRRDHAAAQVLGEYTFESVDPQTVVVSLSAAETAGLPPGRLVHDLEVFTAGDAYVVRVLEGKVRVTPEVTR